MKASDRVHMVDCTLREGDQSSGVWLTHEDKIAIFRGLDAVGVSVVDAGMPAVSAVERQQLRALSMLPDRKARIAASVRSRADEIALAAQCRVDEVFIIFPVSRLHRTRRLGLDEAGWERLGRDVLRAARAHGLTANLVLEDASRADTQELGAALRIAREEGADRVMVCDTVGVLTPAGAAGLVRLACERLGDGVAVGTHFHDDLGMATANTVAAVEAGARWPSVTVNGVGERAGNAVLAEVALAIDTLLGATSGLRPERLVELSREVERRTGVFIPPNAPVVGYSTFDHESGIHVDGVLKAPQTYESVDPDLLGRRRRIVFGKHTGRAGLVAFAQEHGLPHGAEVIETVLDELKRRRPEAYPREVAAFLDARDAYLEASRGVSYERLLAIFAAALDDGAARQWLGQVPVGGPPPEEGAEAASSHLGPSAGRRGHLREVK